MVPALGFPWLLQCGCAVFQAPRELGVCVFMKPAS